MFLTFVISVEHYLVWKKIVDSLTYYYLFSKELTFNVSNSSSLSAGELLNFPYTCSFSYSSCISSKRFLGRLSLTLWGEQMVLRSLMNFRVYVINYFLIISVKQYCK